MNSRTATKEEWAAYMRARRAARPDVREAERLYAQQKYQSDPAAGREIQQRYRKRHPLKVRIARIAAEIARCMSEACWLLIVMVSVLIRFP